MSKFKWSSTKQRLVYIQDAVYEPHGNHKPKTCKRDPQKIKGKESKYNTKESHQITRGERNRKELQKQLENNKMVTST